MDEIQEYEIEALLNHVYESYGHDFRDYARTSTRRRIAKAVREEGLKTISGLQEKVIHGPDCFERFLMTLTVNATEMFRDPAFFISFRKDVVPFLKTYPFVRIWGAGCSSGQEVYSIAMLLEEEGLHENTRIDATYIDDLVLKTVKEGICSLDSMKKYTSNYIKAGGRTSFSDYYTARHGRAIIKPSLKENIVWASHNLATDGSIDEFHVTACRNVMIYFDKALQDRVHKLIYESLVMFGFLALGKSESISYPPFEKSYKAISESERVYRKVS